MPGQKGTGIFDVDASFKAGFNQITYWPKNNHNDAQNQPMQEGQLRKPSEPSQVFFGDIFGNRGVLPNFDPTK